MIKMMIPTIPTPEELLDKGFSRGKKQADLVRSQKIPKHLKGKRIEERRVVTSCQVIKDKLKSILDAVPEIESLHPFYQDYIDITVGVDAMKQALGALNWAYGILTQLEKEYEKLDFEVTVLTKPKIIEVADYKQYLDEIEIGRDGLIIQKGFAKGLLLPQVAEENAFDSKEFLEHTCMKAGISTDSWMDESCDVFKFQGQIFK